jgi:hypothetical protein
MNKCPFYKEYIQRIPSRENCQQLNQVKIIVYPYCNKDDALGAGIAKEIVTSVMGGNRILKCNADIDKCQLNNK